MKRVWPIVAAVIVPAFLFIPTAIYVRQDLGWIDAISGSQKSQTVSRFGVSSTPVVTESLLAARCRKLGLKWEPAWRNVRSTYLGGRG